MQNLKFEYKDSAILTVDHIVQQAKTVVSTIATIKKSLEKQYATQYASIYLPHDQELLRTVKKCVAEKQTLKPTILVVIGIGGSNLGTIAVQEAVLGKMYKKILYADTVDTDYINDLLTIVECELQQKNNVILNVVSKSGTTTETIANFEVFLSLLQKYHPKDYHRYVVATTDKD